MTDQIRNLVERLRLGDRDAFEQLVRRYSNFVFSQAYAVLGNEDESRDVAQEVFIKLFEKHAALERPEAFVAYLKIMARNKALDRLRRNRCGGVPLDSFAELNIEADCLDPCDEMAHNERLNDLKRRLKDAITELPVDQQEIIRLRYEHRLSYNEIAEKLDCGLNVVRGRLYRAHKSLSGLLGPYLREES